jgi:3-hydroxyacyl-CoA dehydrogenase
MHSMSRLVLSRGLKYPIGTRRFLSSSGGIKKVGVLGFGGLLGHGISQTCAQAGYSVIGLEVQQSAIDTGLKRISGSLEKVIARNVKKGVYDEGAGKAEFNKVMSCIDTTTDMNDLKDCDLIIEAVAENMDLKKKIFADFGKITQPNCILASNTSSLQITGMAEVSGRADKVVGLHFFNPVQMMKLCEVVNTDHTSTETFDAVYSFVESINKAPVKCKDTPGFIVNRLLVPYLTQALAMLDRGEASKEDIDTAMRLGASHPMGPIHLADYIGLDTILSILEGWVVDYPNEPTFFVPPVLKQLVAEGKLGRKSGQGFYTWEGDRIKQ